MSLPINDLPYLNLKYFKVGVNSPSDTIEFEILQIQSFFQVDTFGRLMDDEYNQESRFTYNMAQLPNEVRLQIGHQFDDFIKDCTFKGESCLSK